MAANSVRVIGSGRVSIDGWAQAAVKRCVPPRAAPRLRAARVLGIGRAFPYEQFVAEGDGHEIRGPSIFTTSGTRMRKDLPPDARAGAAGRGDRRTARSRWCVPASVAKIDPIPSTEGVAPPAPGVKAMRSTCHLHASAQMNAVSS